MCCKNIYTEALLVQEAANPAALIKLLYMKIIPGIRREQGGKLCHLEMVAHPAYILVLHKIVELSGMRGFEYCPWKKAYEVCSKRSNLQEYLDETIPEEIGEEVLYGS